MSEAEDPHLAFLAALDAAAAVLQHHGCAPDGSTEARETAARLLTAALAIVDANELFGTVDPYDSSDLNGPAVYPSALRGRIGLHLAAQHPMRYLRIEGSFATAARAFMQACDRETNLDPLYRIRERARAETALAKRRAKKRQERARRLAAD